MDRQRSPDAARSDSRLREHVEHALPCSGCGDPHERQVGVEPAVEVEDEAVRRKEERQGGARRVIRMLADVERDRERTRHWTLEAQAEKQTPVRIPATRRQK